MTEAKSNSECPYAMRGLMVVITTEHIFNLEIFTPEQELISVVDRILGEPE